MKFLRLLSFAIVFSSLLLTSCGDDEKNITDIASDDSDLTSLVAALEAAGLTETLSGSTAYTVFAPSNAAFDKFLADNNFDALEDVPTSLLSNILLNHVVAGTTLSTGLSTGYITSAASGADGNPMNMYVSTANGVTLNGVSNVTSADIEADNGVIHKVDAVIGLPTVVTFATADPTFGTLVAALTADMIPTDFVSVLSGEGPFTVFAPTNDAFGDLLEELGVDALGDIDLGTLDAVLKYHVVSGDNVLSGDLTDDMSVTTLGGEFVIDLDNGAEIEDARGRIAPIAVTDVQANNGVIHVISKVILPAE